MIQDSFPRFLESNTYDAPTYSIISSSTTSTTHQAATLGDDIDNGFSTQHEIGLNWTARIAAMLSLLGGLYIFYWSWKRRDHVYHRIMFGMYMYIYSCIQIKISCSPPFSDLFDLPDQFQFAIILVITLIITKRNGKQQRYRFISLYGVLG